MLWKRRVRKNCSILNSKIVISISNLSNSNKVILLKPNALHSLVRLSQERKTTPAYCRYYISNLTCTSSYIYVMTLEWSIPNLALTLKWHKEIKKLTDANEIIFKNLHVISYLRHHLGLINTILSLTFKMRQWN